jgi:hypothetical protein
VSAAAGAVTLGFRTQEDLTKLAQRITAVGHPGVTLSNEYGGELTVTDPTVSAFLSKSAGQPTVATRQGRCAR